LIAAGLMTAMYVDKGSKLDTANTTLKARNSTISTREAEIKQLKSDLQAKSDQLDKSQQDLRGTQTDNEKNKHDKQIVAQCLQLLLAALDAADKGDKATFEKKLNDIKKPCNEAQVIIG